MRELNEWADTPDHGHVRAATSTPSRPRARARRHGQSSSEPWNFPTNQTRRNTKLPLFHRREPSSNPRRVRVVEDNVQWVEGAGAPATRPPHFTVTMIEWAIRASSLACVVVALLLIAIPGLPRWWRPWPEGSVWLVSLTISAAISVSAWLPAPRNRFGDRMAPWLAIYNLFTAIWASVAVFHRKGPQSPFFKAMPGTDPELFMRVKVAAILNIIYVVSFLPLCFFARDSIREIFRSGETAPLAGIQGRDLELRQSYIEVLCKAHLAFGAPGHRLREHLRATAERFHVTAGFQHAADSSMIVWRTGQSKIVTGASVNLEMLRQLHKTSKQVMRGIIGVQEGKEDIEDMLKKPFQYPTWMVVVLGGASNGLLAPAFGGGWRDMLVVAAFATALAACQTYLAPVSSTFASLAEIFFAFVFAFAGRALGSAYGGSLFCFSAIAQASICGILPGMAMLNSVLNLLGCKELGAGSSGFAGGFITATCIAYGLSLGIVVYGLVDKDAVAEATCAAPLDPRWNFALVPGFLFFQCLAAHAKFQWAVLMAVVGTGGFAIDYYLTIQWPNYPTLAHMMAAFGVGVVSNLSSRMPGLHFAGITLAIPAVWMLVPGGMASSGAISSTLASLEAYKEGGVVEGLADLQNAITGGFVMGMINTAVSLAIGFALANFLLYPVGKRRGALWSL
ncbi:hypothetical protein Micbo1qcDRAFT_204952 [Microdochium bolleyi]|uniref:Threonine/serine exporter-like N-terminal domain-containing protein n=1 Tax=Microdochium bolleyi TaxID=196109 RepID=A0A136J0Z6_9PEZI|nr:hypothetical protein Micbo1qcDRAFT_204952 [Microdochium bolleyi]